MMDHRLIVSLEGSLVRLRPVEAGDVDAAQSWHNDPATRDSQLGYPFPVSRSMEEAWLAKAQRSDGRGATFAILRRGAQLIGFTMFDDIHWPARSARFGITIGDGTARRQGFGRETLSLMLKYGFLSLGLERVWLEVVAFNAPAVSLYEAAGFVREGCLRSHAYVGGHRHDVLVLGLLRGEWRDSP
ncbi:MAG TPA: GNAT family protein [Alphaproteobacteria bacterium]|nr:GNAT family protein [Alphaproteobacteria bacterium]